MFAKHITNNTNIFTEDNALHQQCQNIGDKNYSNLIFTRCIDCTQFETNLP